MKTAGGRLFVSYDYIDSLGKWSAIRLGFPATEDGWASALKEVRLHSSRADRRNIETKISLHSEPRLVETLGEMQALLAMEWGDDLARHADEQLQLELEEARRIISGLNDRLDNQADQLVQLRRRIDEQTQTIGGMEIRLNNGRDHLAAALRSIQP